jgi:hypothetical protein
VLHLLSDDHKADRAKQGLLLLTALTTPEKRARVNIGIGDESWVMLVNPSAASRMTIDEELSQRMRQTMRAAKSMLTVFFNPKEFITINMLPQSMSFAAACFTDNMIILYADRYAQQQGGIARSQCIYTSTIPSATLLGMSKRS